MGVEYEEDHGEEDESRRNTLELVGGWGGGDGTKGLEEIILFSLYFYKFCTQGGV